MIAPVEATLADAEPEIEPNNADDKTETQESPDKSSDGEDDTQVANNETKGE